MSRTGVTSGLTLAVLATAAFAGCAGAAAAPPEVHISGNRFVDGSGKTIRLIGTSAGVGSADACVAPVYGEPHRVQSHSVFWAGYDDATLDLMRSWHMNAVRVTVNEQCWLGVNPVKNLGSSIRPARGAKAKRREGAALRKRYRAGIVSLVSRAHAHGFITIVNLHYPAPRSALAWAQWPMPDHELSPAYWRSAVKTFKGDRSMVFEVFNEPFEMDNALSWECLRDGCKLPNGAADALEAESRPNTSGCGSLCPDYRHPKGTYEAAGMQELVNVIRAAGATQPLIVPGLNYSSDLRRWLEFKPRDPLNQLGANFHAYTSGPGLDSPEGCTTQDCWDTVLAPIARQVPIATTEFGQFDCRHDMMDAYQRWADEHGVSYFAWGWFVSDNPPCGSDNHDTSMLLDYATGQPSPEGEGYKAHLAELHRRGELP